jgi:hypothetical protein
MGSPRRLVFAVAGFLFLPFLFPGTVRMPGSLPEPSVQAITALQSIQKAQRLYATACGNGGYAPSIEDLIDPIPGTSTGLLQENFAKRGSPSYALSVVPGASGAEGPRDCRGHLTVTHFYAAAVPPAASRSRRSYAMTQEGTIWQVEGGSAPTEPFRSPARPVQ